MNFNPGTFLAYCALSGALLAFFALVGLPVKLVLRRLDIEAGRVVAAPVFGIAVIVIASWYWAVPFGATKPLARIALAGAVVVAIPCALWLVRTPERLRAIRADPRVRGAVALFALCCAGIGITTFATQGQLFERDQFTVVSARNADAADYANVSQQLLDTGPGNRGHIANYDLGARTTEFPTGATATLAAGASVTGQDVWRVMEPAMFIALVLGAYATATLLRLILPRLPIVAAALAAVLGFSVIYSVHVVAQYLFAQMLGMTIVTTILAVLVLSTQRSGAPLAQRRQRIGDAVVVGILLAAGFAVYPHMAILGTIALAPIACITNTSWRGLIRRTLVTFALLAGAFAIAVALVPGLFVDAVQTTRNFESIHAGYPLPFVFPSEMLGFETTVGEPNGWLPVALSIALLVAIAGVAVMLWRRGFRASVAYVSAGIATVLASYVLVYVVVGGVTYQQWKWITFFIPVLVSFVIGLFLLAAFTSPNRREHWRRVGYAGVVGYGLIAVLVFAPGEGFPIGAAKDSYLSVAPDDVDLSTNPMLAGHRDLHLDTAPYWESMWLAYFLRDKEVSLQADTYYEQSPPISDWYIERNDQPLAAGARAERLNDTYRLVHVARGRIGASR